MPYIRTKHVKEIREQLRKEFPDFKFSITRQHMSCVNIVILEAPFRLKMTSGKTYESVNHFWIKEHYKDDPDTLNVLRRINEIANKTNGVLVEDSDYGTVPRYYVDISIGDWERPFKVVEKQTMPIPQIKTINSTGIKLEQYSEKAIVVFGDTKPIKDELKDLGGKFNKFLKCGPGWIFPKSKESILREQLNLNL